MVWHGGAVSRVEDETTNDTLSKTPRHFIRKGLQREGGVRGRESERERERLEGGDRGSISLSLSLSLSLWFSPQGAGMVCHTVSYLEGEMKAFVYRLPTPTPGLYRLERRARAGQTLEALE
jgi:hypothetical protein